MEIKTIFDFANYRYQNWITLFVFVSALFLLYFSACSFLSSDANTFKELIGEGNEKNLVFVFFWVFGPPAWFYFEYYVLWRDASEEKRNRLKVGRELAKPFWAAALYFLFLTVSK